MFSNQLRAVFRVLGTALLTLANMPADGAERVEMTGKAYIDTLDVPDAGTALQDATTNTAAQVFASHGSAELDADAEKLEVLAGAGAAGPTLAEALHATLPANAAAIFTTADIAAAVAPPAITPGAPNGLPTYVMTAAAGEFTREQYHASNWTDEALIEAGFMEVVQPVVVQDTRPNAPPAPANGTPQVPSAPAIASTSGAVQAEQQGTDAPAPVGGATVDSTGLPWDARIHAGTRTQNADKTWKKKKGTGDVFYNQVVAELRQRPASQPAAPSADPFVPLAAATGPLPGGPGAPQAPAAYAAAPAAAPAAPATDEIIPADFAALCKWVTASGKTMNQALEHAKKHGITAMGFLAQPANAHLIPLVYESMKAA